MDIVREWYLLLSQLSATLSGPLGELAARIQVVPLSAFLFGLIGATAPCQLSTNLAAIAFVSRKIEDRRPWREAVAYTLGKVLVYSALGGAVIGLGLEVQGAALPVAAAARRLLGPLMILIGLMFLGWLRLSVSFGQAVAEAARRRLAAKGPWGAFVMGVIFAFAFCPTLFLLFFGLTIPLGLRSSVGLLVPGLFAVGTAVPLLAYGGLLATGSSLVEGFTRGLIRGHAAVRKIAGAIILLAGINDTFTYWFL